MEFLVLDENSQGLFEFYSVFQTPQWVLFIYGENTVFAEAKSEQNLTDWLEKIVHPERNELREESQMTLLINQEDFVVLLVPEDSENLAVAETIAAFNRLIPKYPSLKMWFSKNNFFHQQLETTQKFTLYFQGKGEEEPKLLESEDHFTFQQMFSFLSDSVNPSMRFLDKSAVREFFGSQVDFFMFLTKNPDREQNEQLKLFYDFSVEKKGEIVFYYADSNKDMGSKMAEYVGLGDEEDNSVWLLQFKEGNLLKYKLRREVTAASLNQFFKDFKESKLEPLFKSQEPQE